MHPAFSAWCTRPGQMPLRPLLHVSLFPTIVGLRRLPNCDDGLASQWRRSKRHQFENFTECLTLYLHNRCNLHCA